MIDPVTLSTLASSFANGFASALGSEAGKDAYEVSKYAYKVVNRGVRRAMIHCQRSSQVMVMTEVSDDQLPPSRSEARTLILTD